MSLMLLCTWNVKIEFLAKSKFISNKGLTTQKGFSSSLSIDVGQFYVEVNTINCEGDFD